MPGLKNAREERVVACTEYLKASSRDFAEYDWMILLCERGRMILMIKSHRF
jgi:hypothetical protein